MTFFFVLFLIHIHQFQIFNLFENRRPINISSIIGISAASKQSLTCNVAVVCFSICVSLCVWRTHEWIKFWNSPETFINAQNICHNWKTDLRECQMGGSACASNNQHPIFGRWNAKIMKCLFLSFDLLFWLLEMWLGKKRKRFLSMRCVVFSRSNRSHMVYLLCRTGNEVKFN